jgi:tetratricopeptide (TPR) repeat protein
MPTNFELNKTYNENLLDEIQFTLQDRKEPTIVLMSVDDYDLQKRLLSKLKEKLSNYQFYDIDLTPFQVESLQETLQKELPKQVVDSERITYCVNVFGLENSRLTSTNGQIVDSGLIAQLNFEREIIFRKPNYITILWGDYDFFLQIQRQAPDLWSWVTNFFVFKQDEEYQEKPLSPEPERIPAKLPIREEYINSLLNKLDHLPLNDPDKGRAMRERLNLYSLLADEYAKYFDYENAKKYYENAIGMSEKLNIKGYDLNKLIFDYGNLNIHFRKFEKALWLLQDVLLKDKKENNFGTFGIIYHQIGFIHTEQRNWKNALENYQEAVNWNQKTKQEHFLGSTYHQIGTVYYEQRNWENALENYQKAINWYQKTEQLHKIGGTYHQIGRVYEGQRRWKDALKNYQQAISWIRKTGQEYELGGTYFQIGVVYTEQRDWKKALEYYQKAIDWEKKTGQEDKLGNIHHQIGITFSNQRNWKNALENYQKAIYWVQKNKQEYLLGNTYHQIGIMYADQRKWRNALKYYQQSIDWNQKTAQEHQLGSTYHQIGRLYEDQLNWKKALENYQNALFFMPDYFEREREVVNRSIERVKEKEFLSH